MHSSAAAAKRFGEASQAVPKVSWVQLGGKVPLSYLSVLVPAKEAGYKDGNARATLY